MDQNLIARRFIVLARKLRDDVRNLLPSFGRDLHEIKNAIQSIDINTHAAENKEHPQKEIIAVLHTPEAIETRRRTESDGTIKRDRIRLFVEWATFFAVVFYGCVAFRQLREMIAATGAAQQSIVESRINRMLAEKSLNATIQQFHLDQRAWVGESELRPPTTDANGVTTTIVVLKNTGKTPAVHVHQEINNDFQIADAPFYPHWWCDVPKHKSNEVLQPGASYMTQTHFPPRVKNCGDETASGDQWRSFARGKKNWYVFGRVYYDDIFQCHHSTTFCVFFAGGKLPESLHTAYSCENYNAVDETPDCPVTKP